MTIRQAYHEGSWYSQDSKTLRDELSKHLIAAEKRTSHLKAIISPHAGYAYSASTAAWGFKQIDTTKIKIIFLIGPAHHINISKICLPQSDVSDYATPLGNLKLNFKVIEDLRKSKIFEQIYLKDDEEEHSLEMQLPFIKFIFSEKNIEDITIVPMIVGNISLQMVIEYADILLPYFQNSEVLFVISSDFCHWGKRFRFTYIPPDCQNALIYEAIERMDRQGVTYIENHDFEGFTRYLMKTRNTICGQNPIKILLKIIEKCCGMNLRTTLLNYKQSSNVRNPNDSSVSYTSLMTEIVS